MAEPKFMGIKRKIQDKVHVSDEIQKLYDKYKTENVKNRESSKLAKKLGIHPRKVWSKIHLLRKQDNIRLRFGDNLGSKSYVKSKGYPSMNLSRHRFMNRRIKQLSVQYPDKSIEQLQELAKHETIGKVSGQKQVDVEFPGIWPLAEHSIKIFEQMVVDLIARKHSKIDYYLASQNLSLIDNKEWGYSTWREFCLQFNLSIPRISEALVGCDAKKLKLEKIDKSWVIRYG